MEKLFWSLLLCLSFTQIGQAQLEKMIHQTFDLSEMDAVRLNLAGDVEIEKWAGNTIMTETHIKLYEASQGIMYYFVKEGRYEIESDTMNETSLRLKSKDMVRKPIKTKTGECYEEVLVKVYLPDDFEVDVNTDTVWNRIEEEEELPEVSTKTDSTSIKSTVPVDSTLSEKVIEKPIKVEDNTDSKIGKKDKSDQ